MKKDTQGLNVAHGFVLPARAQTETFAILAKRNAGKTYTASVMAEEMARLGVRFTAIDPVGVWWGLRASADGKGPGFPVVVLGGEHGDLPLLPTSGEVVAGQVWRENDPRQKGRRVFVVEVQGDYALCKWSTGRLLVRTRVDRLNGPSSAKTGFTLIAEGRTGL